MTRKKGKKLAVLLALAMVFQGVPNFLPGDMKVTVEGGSGDALTVFAADPATTPDPEATTSPEPTTDPEATTSPEPTTDPEASTAPEPTTDPEATSAPEPTSAAWPDGGNVVFSLLSNSQPVASGELIEVTTGEVTIGITNNLGVFPQDAVITWQSYNSQIISIIETESKYTVTVKAVGPGYTPLEAVINYAGYEYKVSCQLHVPLELLPTDQAGQINHSDNGFGMVDSLAYNETVYSKTIQLSGPEDPLHSHFIPMFRYVDYAAGLKSSSDSNFNNGVLLNTMPELEWETSDPTVVIVDSNGYVTAVGAGYAEITVTTKTTADNTKKESKTFGVLVAPAAYVSGSGTENYQNSFEYKATSTSVTFLTNAHLADNLVWTLHKDSADGEILKLDNNAYMKVDISNIGNGITLSEMKAGVYYLTARPTDKYSEENVTVKKLQIKIVVPIMISTNPVVMNVGDFYDLLASANIPNKNLFRYAIEDGSGNVSTIAEISDGIVTGLAEGTGVIKLYYQDRNDIFYDEPGTHEQSYEIPLTVIDGVAINTTSATMYAGSKLQLHLTTSNNLVSVIWSSSDESVLTVDEDGLVTAKTPGNAIVTAKQTINGVTKYATCNIRVVAAVTSITLDPQSKTLDIGDLLTINATVSPKLNSVSLHWVSSDEKVVSIQQRGDLSATVKAVAGGTAVITAINQDNVVVGSCLITVKQPIVSISLSQTKVTVPLSNRNFQLYATISPESAKNEEIVWKSTDTSVITVDQYGMVTLKKAGTAAIICSSKEDGNISAICNVVVTRSVTGIKLDQTTLNMFVGETYRLTYVVSPSDASDVSVTWTSTNTSVLTVDSKGLIKAKGVGQSVVILKTADGGYMATCVVTVERTATAVKLDVNSLTLNTGDYYYFQTTITPTDSTDVNLSWETSDKQVAIISNKGKVTAKKPGVAIILVRTKSGSTAYCTVTVQQGVTGVELDSKEETIYVDDEIELLADVLPRTATVADVTWSSSKTSVARVDKEGNVTGVAPGVAIITCTTVDGGYVDYCVIIVQEREVEVTDLKVEPASYRLGVGKTYHLTAVITPENATNKELAWSSSNNKVVTVDKNGRIKGIKAGTAVITCEATDGSGVEAYCEVEVCYEVTDISLNYDYLDMVVGESETLSAAIMPENATYGVIWESEDPTIARVNRTTGKVTALKAGNTNIIAKADDNSGVTNICYVNVKNPVATTNIQVSESEIVMIPEENKTVSFTILPAGHTDGYVWSSDNPVVASVNSRTGMITAHSMGTANITIFADSGKSATVKVYVVGLSKTTLTLQQYSSTIISLEVYGASKSDLEVKWYSDNERIAEVANGRITARAVGTTYVYAVVNGRTLACRVTVEKIRSK